MTWNPSAELRHIEDAAAEGTAEVYGDLLGRCPVGRVAVDGSKIDWWGVFGHAELLSAARNFRALSSTTPSDGPRIVPLQADPPLHTDFRKLLNEHFSPEAVGRLADDIRDFAGEMLDGLVGRGRADFAEEFAFPFPTRVLCRFLGVPDDQWPVHHDFVMTMDKATGHGLNDPDVPVPDEIFGGILPHLQRLIADHREHPRDDVVSGILSGRLGDRPPQEPEILNLIVTIMLAGHITTTSGLGNTVLRLARDPELQDLLRARPDRIPDAIEESLRIDTPQQAMPRRCVADTELGGETIRAGEYVLLNFGSANVDPAAWPDAATFDLDRADKRHLAFGRGLHQCIGQGLARLEMRIALEELLARTSSFALDGSVRRRTWPLLAMSGMPLSLRPAGPAGPG